LGLDAAVAGHVDFPTRIDANHTDVLDPRLGAVARTAAHRQLDLVRRVHAPEGALELLAHAGRILGTESAPFGTDTGLYRPQCLGVGVARGHVEVAPDLRKILLLDS